MNFVISCQAFRWVESINPPKWHKGVKRGEAFNRTPRIEGGKWRNEGWTDWNNAGGLWVVCPVLTQRQPTPCSSCSLGRSAVWSSSGLQLVRLSSVRRLLHVSDPPTLILSARLLGSVEQNVFSEWPLSSSQRFGSFKTIRRCRLFVVTLIWGRRFYLKKKKKNDSLANNGQCS